MSVQPRNNSNSKLNWSQLPGHIQKNKVSNISDGKNPLIFVTDFTSPTDEIKKFQPSKSESQNSAKKSRPFPHTSENWIG